MKKESKASAAPDYSTLERITQRAFFMALRMIDIANHERPTPERGEPKVGGHPSACASSKHILAAIHLYCRTSDDFFACKPHVSPIDHAFNFLLHNFRTMEGKPLSEADRKIAMRNLRHYSSTEPVFQSYHSDFDPDSYRYFPSGSVGIPPVNALYTALAYQYAKDHGYKLDEDPYFWCLMGDSEYREGSLAEAMPDAAERQLGNLVWIVDYNRQNLDGTRVLNEKAMGGSDADRILKGGAANGWRTVALKHGSFREELFKTPGGDEFQRVLDHEFTDFEFQAILEAGRPKLTREVLSQKSSKLKSWLKNLNEEEIHRAFLNLGGHDLKTLITAFDKIRSTPGQPTLVVAYTIKGHGLACQAQSGNHSALPEKEELVEMAKSLGCDFENPFEDFGEKTAEEKYLAKRRDLLLPGIEKNLQAAKQRRSEYEEQAKQIQWPHDFGVTALKFNPVAHTQWMWGQIAAKLDRLARDADPKESLSATDAAWKQVAPFFLTMAPDVGSSTNTSPNMNGKLYGDIGQEDFEKVYGAKDEKAPDIIPNDSPRTGHIRFEIAEGNCMSAAGSFGKMGKIAGLPFYPAMTIYDFFIKRALDQYYYNLYWHSHFAVMGTPSGITLAPEGAQHSWKSDIQIPNCITWEPCYAKELEWILADELRRHFTGESENREAALIRCVTKGMVQKEWLTRLKRQARYKSNSDALLTLETADSSENIPEDVILSMVRDHVLEGGYALIDYQGYEDYCPGDNVVHIFAMGALVAEAIKASDSLLKKGILANVFIVTSPDLLLGNFAYHKGYSHLQETLGVTGNLNLGTSGSPTTADFLSLQSSQVPVVSVHDGEPGLLDNIGSIVGTKQIALAVRKTSKSGTTADIFHYHGLDGDSIAEAAEKALEAASQGALQISKELLGSLRDLGHLEG